MGKPSVRVLSPSALAVLHRVTLDGCNVRLPPEQLDRKVYTEVSEALANLGGKWNRKAQAIVFTADPTADLQSLLDGDGAWVDQKKALQWFPTPASLARRVANLADIPPKARVLEPSAGHGALIDACLEAQPDLLQVVAVEVDPKKCEFLRAKYKDHGDRVLVIEGDFLKLKQADTGVIDRVVMNPPFAKQGDIDHVTHAFNEFLCEGDDLVAIMTPAAIDERRASRWKKYRAFYNDIYLTSSTFYVKNPAGSFSESGTEVETITLCLAK